MRKKEDLVLHVKTEKGDVEHENTDRQEPLATSHSYYNTSRVVSRLSAPLPPFLCALPQTLSEDDIDYLEKT